MISSEFRVEARKRLAGKWGKVVCISLAYLLISFAIGFILGLFGLSESFCSIIETVINVPLLFGLTIVLFKVFNQEDSKAFDFFTIGFKNFGKSWIIALYTALKIIIPIILYSIISYIFSISVVLTIFSGFARDDIRLFGWLCFIVYIVSIIWIVIISYYYQLSNIVAIDNPQLTPKEAVNKSKELMTGNHGKLFCLEFSFIGWAILSALTFGIGLLWLIPYMQFSTFAFYNYVSGKESGSSTSNNVIEETGPISE